MSVPVVSVVLLLAASPSPQPVYFEQTTVSSVDGERRGPGVQSRVWHAGDRMRMEAGGEAGGPAMVLRLDRGVAYRLDPARREATRLDLATLTQRAREDAAAAGGLMGAGPGQDVRVTKLRHGKSVAGHACRGFRLRAGSTIMDVYVAPGVPLTAGAFADMLEWTGARQAMPELVDALERLPGFPMETRARVTVLGETHETVATITKLALQPIPAALFDVPKGYRVKAPDGMGR